MSDRMVVHQAGRPSWSRTACCDRRVAGLLLAGRSEHVTCGKAGWLLRRALLARWWDAQACSATWWLQHHPKLVVGAVAVLALVVGMVTAQWAWVRS